MKLLEFLCCTRIFKRGKMVLPVTEDTPPDMLAGSMDLRVVLPDGHTIKMSVERSTPMMDLLVQVTTLNKMTPAGHVLQAMGEHGVLPYKPSTPIGALEAWTIHIVPKNKAQVVQKKAPLKPANQQQPFEQTFRLQVHLPRNQLYVMRVSPRTLLCDILQQTCSEKNLDPSKYEMRHPADLSQLLSPSCSLADYGLQEVTVVARSRGLGQALSSSDIMALQREEDKRRQAVRQQHSSAGVSLVFNKRSRSSVCEGSVSSDSLGGRSISPARSDESVSRSVSPPAPVMAPPTRPARKRRPAPKPPAPPDGQAHKQNAEQQQNEEAVNVSHSRNSSDSSGYHEASVLSDGPVDMQHIPDTLPRRPVKSQAGLSRSMSSLTAATSTTSLTSVSGQKKKKAPPPPPINKTTSLERHLSGKSNTQPLDKCSTLPGKMKMSQPDPESSIHVEQKNKVLEEETEIPCYNVEEVAPVPAVLELAPVESQSVPAVSELAPVESSESVPAVSELAPVASASVSAELELPPVLSESVPALSELAPVESSESVPAELELAPVLSDSPPALSELAPVLSESVPTVSELPSVETDPAESELAPVEAVPAPVEFASPSETEEAIDQVEEAFSCVTAELDEDVDILPPPPTTTEDATTDDWQYQLPAPPTAFRDSLMDSAQVFAESDVDLNRSVTRTNPLFIAQEYDVDLDQQNNESESNNSNNTQEPSDTKQLYENSDLIDRDSESISVDKNYLYDNEVDDINCSRARQQTAGMLSNFTITTYQRPQISEEIYADITVKPTKLYLHQKFNSSDTNLSRTNSFSDEAVKQPANVKRSTSHIALTLQPSRTKSVSNLEKQDEHEHLLQLQEQFLQLQKQLLQNSSLLEKQSSTAEAPLQSLHVLKSILPQLGQQQVRTDINSKILEDNQNSQERQTELKEESAKDGETNEQGKQTTVVTVNNEKQTEPKRYVYSGPPAVNLTTWSERPKSQVSIKMDGDYRIGVGQNNQKETRNEVNVSKPIVNVTETKEFGSSATVSLQDSQHNNPSRVPIVRSVELKKSFVEQQNLHKPTTLVNGRGINDSDQRSDENKFLGVNSLAKRFSVGVRPVSAYGRIENTAPRRYTSVVGIGADCETSTPAVVRVNGFTVPKQLMPVVKGFQFAAPAANKENKLIRTDLTSAGNKLQQTDSTSAGIKLQRTDSTSAGRTLQQRDSTSAGNKLQQMDSTSAGIKLQRTDSTNVRRTLQQRDSTSAGNKFQWTDSTSAGNKLQRTDSTSAGRTLQQRDLTSGGSILQWTDPTSTSSKLQQRDAGSKFQDSMSGRSSRLDQSKLPRPPLITAALRKPITRPKTLPVANPRDQLMDAIRNFGGRENLRQQSPIQDNVVVIR